MSMSTRSISQVGRLRVFVPLLCYRRHWNEISKRYQARWSGWRYVFPTRELPRCEYGVQKMMADGLGASAPTFETVQRNVKTIIEGKIIVGHAIFNDLAVSRLRAPNYIIACFATPTSSISRIQITHNKNRYSRSDIHTSLSEIQPSTSPSVSSWA